MSRSLNKPLRYAPEGQEGDLIQSVSHYAPPDCAHIQIARDVPQATEALIENFLRDYPAELVDPEHIEAVTMSTAQLDAITGYLACLGQLPDAGPTVPEHALSLFASRRYGREAMLLLNRRARAGDADARAFAKRIRSYLHGPR